MKRSILLLVSALFLAVPQASAQVEDCDGCKAQESSGIGDTPYLVSTSMHAFEVDGECAPDCSTASRCHYARIVHVTTASGGAPAGLVLEGKRTSPDGGTTTSQINVQGSHLLFSFLDCGGKMLFTLWGPDSPDIAIYFFHFKCTKCVGAGEAAGAGGLQ